MLSVENNVKLLRKEALGVSELLTLFEYEQTISELPFRPHGGQLFIFRSTDSKKMDWTADGHS